MNLVSAAIHSQERWVPIGCQQSFCPRHVLAAEIDLAFVNLYVYQGIRRDPLNGGGVAEWLKAAVC